MKPTARLAAAVTAGALGATVLLPIGAGAQDASSLRQSDFTAAAREFGVPSSVLMAVSYNESLWEAHAGQPSTTGGYGPMALTDVPAGTPTAKGDGSVVPADQPALHTLTTAAGLLHIAPAALKSSDGANIRGGAALLASYARSLNHGALPTDVTAWYDAVARYDGSTNAEAAQRFADDVYATIRTGTSRRTEDGQSLSLAADPNARPSTAQPAAPDTQAPECPADLSCTYIPAAYAPDSSTDKTNYGNYDLANRPNQGPAVRYIVIHDTESSYNSTVSEFQNPAAYASANYVVDGTAGTVTQMVPTKDVAWQAGNWYVNTHSVGIEQVGYAVQGATWFTEKLYRTTATLVRYLATRFHVQLDRQHIIGHDNVPGIAPAYIPGMHWDPGPFWNWGHFMNLLGQHVVPTGSRHSPVVTINPVFANNIQQVTDCESGAPVAPQAASFVYLRTAPSATAPLFDDPGLFPKANGGTTCANDWGDKASAGQQFAVADRSGDWIAIWWDGAKVWFENPDQNQVVTHSSALVVRPKPGLASVPTFGVAYPDAADYPADIPVRAVTALPYVIQPGQSYVFGGATPTDYYYANTIDNSAPDDHTDVVGRTRYLEIQLGHRVGFVKASDVQVVPAVG